MISKITEHILIILCLFFSFSVNAATVKAIWSGIVPGSAEADNIIITGDKGELTQLKGEMQLKENGGMRSTKIVMESRTSASIESQRTLNRLTFINWTLTSADITYDGIKVDNTLAKVHVNGSELPINHTVMNSPSIITQVDYPKTEPSNPKVGVFLTMIASSI
ncbi:hypothetical protein FCV50_18320 [Vibrio kanaloae]|uniref:YceI family protein n=1 Tax=Vibrio kanaloae TaxID=170673 RepID=A0A4U1Z4A7_9VIBR|nr:hypothetical protein [Vibrio kanaloae]TKF28179.1 hypothetical protein FCV50_18320 [Vibrio kanaloae]